MHFPRATTVASIVVALVTISCSDSTDAAAPTTTTSTTTTTTTTTTSTSTTTTTVPVDPAAAVALVLRKGANWNGEAEPTAERAYLGTYLGRADVPRFLAFDGLAGSPDEVAAGSAPHVRTGSEWPPDRNLEFAAAFVDGVLPAFVDDADLDEPPPFDGHDTVFVEGVLISGTEVDVPWEIVEFDDHHVVIRADHHFETSTVQRGAEATLVGAVTAEFRVGRTNPLDAEGRLDLVFDLTNGNNPTVPVHQWWEAVPLEAAG